MRLSAGCIAATTAGVSIPTPDTIAGGTTRATRVTTVILNGGACRGATIATITITTITIATVAIATIPPGSLIPSSYTDAPNGVHIPSDSVVTGIFAKPVGDSTSPGGACSSVVDTAPVRDSGCSGIIGASHLLVRTRTAITLPVGMPALACHLIMRTNTTTLTGVNRVSTSRLRVHEVSADLVAVRADISRETGILVRLCIIACFLCSFDCGFGLTDGQGVIRTIRAAKQPTIAVSGYNVIYRQMNLIISFCKPESLLRTL